MRRSIAIWRQREVLVLGRSRTHAAQTLKKPYHVRFVELIRSIECSAATDVFLIHFRATAAQQLQTVHVPSSCSSMDQRHLIQVRHVDISSVA